MNGEILVVPVGPDDHVAGPDNALVTLVEYGDFECPFCGMAYPIVKAIQRELGDQLRFVYRHFPLSEIHPLAVVAAEASEAAHAQNRFWDMHAAIFGHQANLDRTSLVRYAEQLGLDVARFERELQERTHASRVRRDFRSGVRSGVNGTPTFFLNGVRYDGRWTDEPAFIRALQDAALRQSSLAGFGPASEAP
ncbi:MAG: DsbA family protein [Longimicrobiales bacterium]